MSRTQQKAGGISVHAVDIAHGVPANGLHIQVYRIDDGKQFEIAHGNCNCNGLLEHQITKGSGVERGLYSLRFNVGQYYRNANADTPNPCFLEVAEFRFTIDLVHEHFHLPIKFTPWGYSLFRGGA